MKRLYIRLLLLFICFSAAGQQSVARQWNEVLLEAVRNDLARPTLHARNLFHVSAAMYDAWAIVMEKGKPYLTGNEIHGFYSNFSGFSPTTGSKSDLVETALSYAAYRLIDHRFSKSPGVVEIRRIARKLMVEELGLDVNYISTDYQNGSAAALGNFIASEYIAFGIQDGSSENQNYINLFYQPVNDPFDPVISGNEGINDPNRWQPLSFETFRDQSGNISNAVTPAFLGPEWGNTKPFSMANENITVFNKDGFNYNVYHDPGPPPFLDMQFENPTSQFYKEGFAMVALWSGHLDGSDSTLIDISPASLGNIDLESFPETPADFNTFYNFEDGGDIGRGYDMNPVTGMPYNSQFVKLGDYTRVLAEFWADGPDSETPPGHWFTILNYVNDHPQLQKKMMGEGEILDALEWDVKSYFTLGGAMHDAAVAAWSIKGYYDYIRPISAIRFMAGLGQSSSTELPNYHFSGFPLVEGKIELVSENDPLVGNEGIHLNKIKLWAWKGPGAIENPATNTAGVGWILAENWWPYQRPTFITPPFAGYISGHSTFSRAAAEVLTLLTGDEYFPGGIGEFLAQKNDFLVFEAGPTEDIVLQWATYRDASDQCSLSRIWGGIHPPADDIPGRKIGALIGNDAFDFAREFFEGRPVVKDEVISKHVVFPNPVANSVTVSLDDDALDCRLLVYDATGRLMAEIPQNGDDFSIEMGTYAAGLYLLKIIDPRGNRSYKIIKE